MTLLLSLAVRKGFLLGLVLLSACTINVGPNDPKAQKESVPVTLTPANDSPGTLPSQGANSIGAEAGERYLEIVNDVNCAMRSYILLENSYALGDGTFDYVGLVELQPALSYLAEARESAVRNFLKISWPESVAAEIDLLSREWSKLARLEYSLSEAPDIGTFEIVSAEYRNFTTQSNPGYIRATLGVGPSSETDRC